MRNAAFLLLLWIVVPSLVAAPPTNTYTFQSRRTPGQTDHVVIKMKAGGETKFTDQGRTQREKVDIACDLEYDEKTLETPADGEGLWRSVRNYTAIHVGDDEFQPTLRPDRRLICAEANGQTTLLFSPRGLLTRSELDLIEVQGNTLLWDKILPEKAVAVHDTWKHSDAWMAAMLGLDEVAKTDVQSRLQEVTDKVARFEVNGRAEGAIHGATTRIELKGRYRFDLRSKRIDWLAMVIKESRDVSFVADGIDASSVFQMTANPIGDVHELSDEALKNVPLKSSPELTQLTHHSAGGGWQFDHDRRWHVFREKNDSAVLRMMDRGEALGQCNVSSLADRAPDKLVSLDEFQSDVQKALGENFGGFIEASEKPDDAHHRVLRVVAEGKASDIPIQWTYYHVADSKGRQAAFVFTVEKSLLERFADADRLLVQSLRFVEPKPQEVVARGDSGETAEKQ